MTTATRLYAPSVFDCATPHHARVYDCLLGGKDNFPADREVARNLLDVAPDSGLHARAQRAFLVRAVRFIAESGIRQFIDLGAGIPTAPNLHQIARTVHPAARVVYVDFDAMVIRHSDALLTTNDGVTAIQEDIRLTDGLLSKLELQTVIDFTEPVGVLLLNTLHEVADEHDPAGIVARFRDRIALGSLLGISQFTNDSHPEAMARLEAAYANTPWPILFRSHEQISSYFDGFELLPPGVVDIEQWRPGEQTLPTALRTAGGVGCYLSGRCQLPAENAAALCTSPPSRHPVSSVRHGRAANRQRLAGCHQHRHVKNELPRRAPGTAPTPEPLAAPTESLPRFFEPSSPDRTTATPHSPEEPCDQDQ
jgi:hypothetical protein